MDVTYTLFRRLMLHWQQSVEADGQGHDYCKATCGSEQQMDRLIAQFGRSWPDACLVFEEE